MLLAAIALAIVALVLLELGRRTRRRHVALFAALLEQGRREDGHHIGYRHDQRVHAIQQRLSRDLGKSAAFSEKTRHRIEKGLRS